MDRQIRRLGVALLVLFLALFAQVNYLQVFAADELANHTGNAKRLLIAEYNVDRGDIRARDDRTILARSVPTEGEFKYQRQYPHGDLYAAITGYYSIVSGRSGLEQSMNEYLSGRAEELVPSKFVDEIRGRDRRGAAVVTTIDPALQKVARAALGSRLGGVAAIDPKTGEVLALVSNPSYDPNPLASHDPRIARSSFESLDPDSGRTPLLSIASQQLFPPGSTFKIVTTAAALENGRRPDTTYPNPSELDLPQTDSCASAIGPHSCRMRFSRKAELPHTRRSYCSLSRTFCAAVSGGPDCAPAGSAATRAATIMPLATRQVRKPTRILSAPCCGQHRAARGAQSTIVKPPLTLSTWPVM
jgi:peptidoglycan glycosyltransferase